MTGRRLYDKHCDSLKVTVRRVWNAQWERYDDKYAYIPEPSAWPFLTDQQQRFWNDMARRVTPKPRKTKETP